MEALKTISTLPRELIDKILDVMFYDSNFTGGLHSYASFSSKNSIIDEIFSFWTSGTSSIYDSYAVSFTEYSKLKSVALKSKSN